MDGLAHYVEKILSPALRRYGVSESFVRHTAGIVDLQASSLLRHWNEVNYRKTLLLIGAEEGPFYEPAGKYDVKCFVVVAIRNSPIETIQSKNFKDTGLDHPVSDRDIRAITSRAIDYFNAQDFDTLCREVRRSEKPDFYREITNKYPTAWTALRHLAAAPAKVAEYQGVSVNAPYQFEKFKLETFDADRDNWDRLKHPR